MIVLKFGGTSVGTSESLANVKRIVEGLNDDAVVVVSALGGLTDRLIATAKGAADGHCDYLAEWDSMARRHYDIIDNVIGNPDKRIHTREMIRTLLGELRNLYTGVNLINYLPEPTLNRIVSLGERMSSVIVANMIEGATHVDSLKIIKTEKWFDKTIASVNLTNTLIKAELEGMGYPVVMGGFISADKDSGEITNLGRGGSDYTAALVAAAMDADVLQIWTDVDGFLTTDPRIVKDARVIKEMSFVESMDLCSFGAKVVYPPTIYPVFHKNIPIRILNTHNPEAPGTLICEHPADDGTRSKYGVAGISALKGQCIVSLSGKIVEEAGDLSSRVFNSLSRKGLKAGMKADGERKGVFSFVLPASDGPAALQLLREEFAPEIAAASLSDISVQAGMTIVAAVGDRIRENPSLHGLILKLITNSGVKIAAHSDKVSETTLSYLVDEEDTGKVLGTLHEWLFERG